MFVAPFSLGRRAGEEGLLGGPAQALSPTRGEGVRTNLKFDDRVQ